MLVKFQDWKIPTDADFAFRLRPLEGEGAFLPRAAPGVTDIREVARDVMLPGEAERFETRVKRWSGPEDRDTSGHQPYVTQQLLFDDRPSSTVLGAADVEMVLRGTVRVLRGPHHTDYILRDHHMLDVVLYHYRLSGLLPRALFHADRHSDWCKDSFLERRIPEQAATWWKLLHGLKRPGGAPVLEEDRVVFATAKAEHQSWMSGSNVGAATMVPWFLNAGALTWQHALERESVCDWVSLDLDYFQPSVQLRLARGLIRDERFQRLMLNAPVRVFVLSPQFTNGGEKIPSWEVEGSMASSLRLLNLLRTLSAV